MKERHTHTKRDRETHKNTQIEREREKYTNIQREMKVHIERDPPITHRKKETGSQRKP